MNLFLVPRRNQQGEHHPYLEEGEERLRMGTRVEAEVVVEEVVHRSWEDCLLVECRR